MINNQDEYLIVNFIQLVESLSDLELLDEAIDHLKYHKPELITELRDRILESKKLPALLSKMVKIRV